MSAAAAKRKGKKKKKAVVPIEDQLLSQQLASADLCLKQIAEDIKIHDRRLASWFGSSPSAVWSAAPSSSSVPNAKAAQIDRLPLDIINEIFRFLAPTYLTKACIKSVACGFA